MAGNTIENALRTAIKQLSTEQDRVSGAIREVEGTLRRLVAGVGKPSAPKRRRKKRKTKKGPGRPRKVGQKKTSKKKKKRKKSVWTPAMRAAARARGKKAWAAKQKKKGG